MGRPRVTSKKGAKEPRDPTAVAAEAGRLAAGLSQRDAAQSLDIAENTLGRYERGERPLPMLVAERMEGVYGLARGAIRTPISVPRETAATIRADLFGRNVRSRREFLNMGTAELATAIDFPSANAVKQLEAGSSDAKLRVKYLPRLCTALRTSEAELLRSDAEVHGERAAAGDPSRDAAAALLEIILEMRRLTGIAEGAHRDLIHRSADGGPQ